MQSFSEKDCILAGISFYFMLFVFPQGFLKFIKINSLVIFQQGCVQRLLVMSLLVKSLTSNIFLNGHGLECPQQKHY